MVIFPQELFEQWQNKAKNEQKEDGERSKEKTLVDEEGGPNGGEEEDSSGNSVPHRYFPPVVGKLKCLKEVHDRVAGNMQTFSQLSHPWVDLIN